MGASVVALAGRGMTGLPSVRSTARAAASAAALDTDGKGSGMVWRGTVVPGGCWTAASLRAATQGSGVLRCGIPRRVDGASSRPGRVLPARPQTRQDPFRGRSPGA
ncbi:hypothetical protein GCM10010469_01720 [Streptomyces labedae]|uniref:Secreted protein n=1 Tax=Streptomyces labedae TaxID=285569 RepID=A0ABP6QV87_9ACTN